MSYEIVDNSGNEQGVVIKEEAITESREVVIRNPFVAFIVMMIRRFYIFMPIGIGITLIDFSNYILTSNKQKINVNCFRFIQHNNHYSGNCSFFGYTHSS